MVDVVNSREITQRALEFYEQSLRTDLERDHFGEFIAIEPDSQSYFLGATFSEAVRAARRAYPDRITYTKRIGHEFAVQIGGAW